jgi:hypothetical protein
VLESHLQLKSEDKNPSAGPQSTNKVENGIEVKRLEVRMMQGSSKQGK